MFLTADGGESWLNQDLNGVQRASFLQDGSGWAAGNGMLYRRAAGEAEWQSTPLPEAVSGWSSSEWRAVQVGTKDMRNGWLVVQMPTSTIFSVGKLLRTTDGGNSWQILDLPFAAEISWLDAQTGWLSGGVSGRELYRTTDGGESWLETSLPGNLAQVKVGVFLSQVQAARDGTLTLSATVSWAKTPQMQSYTSRDGGRSWQLTDSIELHEGEPLSALAQTGGLYADGARLRSPSAAAGFDFKAPVAQLGSNGSGLVWAVTRQGTCSGVKGEDGFSCSSNDSLWLSVDSGVTWRLMLP